MAIISYSVAGRAVGAGLPAMTLQAGDAAIRRLAGSHKQGSKVVRKSVFSRLPPDVSHLADNAGHAGSYLGRTTVIVVRFSWSETANATRPFWASTSFLTEYVSMPDPPCLP